MAFRLEPRAGQEKTYVTVMASHAVRDCQIDTGYMSEPGDDEKWQDLETAEIYIGMFQGKDMDEAVQKAAQFMTTDPRNVRAYEIA